MIEIPTGFGVSDFFNTLIHPDREEKKAKPKPATQPSSQTHLTKNGTIYRMLDNGQIEIVRKGEAMPGGTVPSDAGEEL